jgi:hypothetical protein
VNALRGFLLQVPDKTLFSTGDSASERAHSQRHSAVGVLKRVEASALQRLSLAND